MTICLVTDNFPPDVGGVGILYRHLSRILTAGGHKVIVLCAGKGDGEDEVVQENGATVIRLHKNYNKHYRYYRVYFRPGGHDAPHWLAMGLCVREWLIQNARGNRIDIIEVSDYGGLGFFLLHPFIPPYVVTANSALLQLQSYSNFSETDHTRVLKQFETLSFRYASRVLAHSTLNQSALETVISRRVDLVLAPWSGLEARYPASESAPPLVVGGLQATKGAIYMAAVVEEIVRKDPSFVMHWIGYDSYTAPTGELMSVFLSKHFPATWNKNFIWLGEKDHEETLQAIAASSLVMIPSNWETFSYVAIEAAALQKPIILTATTGAAYLFEQGKSAMIVSPENKQAFATAVIQMLQNPAIGKGLAQQSATVLDQLHPSVSVPERLKIYREVIDESVRQGDVFEREFHFMKPYLTSTRKFYYSIRAALKKMIKRNA